ncbi:MAG: hypothetical protein R3231_08770 [bacterium]|nr:hypothetical protein [bacterium]
MRHVLECPVWFRVLSVVFIVSHLSGCLTSRELVTDMRLHQNLQVWRSSELQKAPVGKLAIVPFASPPLTETVVSAGDGVCSFCGVSVAAHKDFAKAGERLATYLYGELFSMSSLELVPMEEVYSLFQLEHGRHDFFRDADFILSLGRRLGADAVVAGEVLRIKEREGGDYSVVNPSSVSFRITMFRVSDGSEIYRAVYDETQRPLSEQPERLLQPSKLRFRWLTADELAKGGMRDVAATFPGAPVRQEP